MMTADGAASHRLIPPAAGAYARVPVDTLHLDARNPRLAEYGLTGREPQEEVLRTLWKRMAVDEVAMSIAASGYWDHEPLFITEESGNDVVIEGNRRVAAVRILRSPKLQREYGATDLPTPSAEVMASLETLPAIRIKSRGDIWRYLGFKHVNGPAKWRSYAKAEYIAFVRQTTGATLETIAEQIGDRHRTVQRLYRALMVLRQAEKAGVYRRELAYRRQLAFSHLTTALDYEGFARFLSLADESDESLEPVAPHRMQQLGEVCAWLWGDNRGEGTRPVVETQNPNLRELERVLSCDQALATLRSGLGLAAAYEVSKGDDVVFADALQAAKNSLIKAQGRVSAGYRGEANLLELADTVAEMAQDLAGVMHRKCNLLRSSQRAKLPALG